MEFLKYSQDGHVGLLTISRPKALNALNTALLAELQQQLETLKTSDVRALIITGDGEKAFVAGADIAEMEKLTPKEAEEFCAFGNRVMSAIEQFPSPVIAAVNGYALGGGCELALACDIRLASENAVFAFPEVTLGILPGFGGLQRMARIAGAGDARILAFTAERVKAQEAADMGLVDRVYPANALMENAAAMAKKIAANAPIGVRGAKSTLNNTVGLTLQQANLLEQTAFGACFGTQDQMNAMGAFLKREPPAAFVGR